MRVLGEPTSRAVSLMTVGEGRRGEGEGKGYAVGGALHLHLFDSLVYPSFEILSIPRSDRFAMFFVPGSEKNGFPDPGASFLQLGELNAFLYFIFIYACVPF